MQLKGLVRFFAIALILISLYQLSFTFLVRNYEKTIEQQAENDVAKQYPTPEKKYPGSKELQGFYSDTLEGFIKQRRQEIVDSTSSKQIAGFPWYITYTKAKEKELNLGLDLVGGMNVVLEVNVEDVIRALSGHSKDAAFNRALDRANELKKTNQTDYVTLFGQAYAEVAPQGKLATIFANAYQKDINFNSTNQQVLDMIRRESRVAIKNTYIVLQKRIDKFGVAQPNISLDENKGLISVELAGVDNAARVHKYLQATANLEFREVYKNSPEFVQNVLSPMNDAIRTTLNASNPARDAAAATDTTKAKAATAAVQDHDRALIVGRTTFGKSLLMQTFPLTDGSRMSLVIGQVRTPCGRIVQREYHTESRRAFYRDAGESADTVSRPSCRTDGGRTVYGGGGIVPDVVLPETSSPRWLAQASERGLLLTWAAGYAAKATTPATLDALIKLAALDAESRKDFRDYAASNGVVIPSEADADELLSRLLIRYVAFVRFGNAGYFRLAALNDPSIRRSIDAFDKAPASLRP